MGIGPLLLRVIRSFRYRGLNNYVNVGVGVGVYQTINSTMGQKD